jgi:DNA-binding response OmpR family regulator
LGRRTEVLAPGNEQRSAVILVIVDDVELRNGVEALLLADGHRIIPVRNENDGIGAALRDAPDLILVSLDQLSETVAAIAVRVRAGAGLTRTVPIVMFSDHTIEEGSEVAVGENMYATWPADFNQLRRLLRRLLGGLMTE